MHTLDRPRENPARLGDERLKGPAAQPESGAPSAEAEPRDARNTTRDVVRSGPDTIDGTGEATPRSGGGEAPRQVPEESPDSPPRAERDPLRSED